MGVLASILVFLGLSMFGVVIFNKIGEGAKSLILLAVSAFFTSFGLIKMKKDSKYYIFFTSLASCGLGAFYITFMIMYFGFGIFSMFGVCIVLLLWTIATALLSRYKANIFTFICYAGTAISTVLCSLQWKNSPISLIFYYVSLILLFFLHREKEYNKSGFYFIQLPVMSMLLMLLNGRNHPITVFVIMVIALLALILQNLCFRLKEQNTAVLFITTLLTVGTTILGMAMINDITKYSGLCKLLFMVIMIVLTLLYYLVYRKSSLKFLYYVLFFMTAASGAILYYNLTFLFYLPLIILGMILRKRYLRYTGYGFLMLGTFLAEKSWLTELTDSVIPTLWVLLAITILLFVLNIAFKDVIDKYILTGLIFLVLSALNGRGCLTGAIAFTVFSAFAIFMCTKFYSKIGNDPTIVNGIPIPGTVMKIIMMITGIVMIFMESTNLHIVKDLANTKWLSAIIIMLVTLVLFIMNTKKMFIAAKKTPVWGVLICAKFTIYILACLIKFDTVNYLISVIGLVVAIACISIGFSMRHKEFRIYGLVLSLICVAKLILLDISYNTILLRPVGFVVAGLLCFAISWIYSRLEKKIQ